MCHTRAVDVLAVGRAESAVVHEVIAERDDDNDEWMYVLEAGASQQCKAVAKCLEGRYAEAMAELDGADASTAAPAVAPPPVPRSALVLRLRGRAEQALLHEPAAFAARACGCARQAESCDAADQ
jgi:hypothetical protein